MKNRNKNQKVGSRTYAIVSSFAPFMREEIKQWE